MQDSQSPETVLCDVAYVYIKGEVIPLQARCGPEGG